MSAISNKIFNRLHIALFKNAKNGFLLSDDSAHIFFGYYDLSPFSYNDDKILCLRASHDLKTPTCTSNIEVGFFLNSLSSVKNEFKLLNNTSAWCWQQGCRLQWYPKVGKTDLIFFNICENESYKGIIQDSVSGMVVKYIPYSIYEISNCGTQGLFLNFSRLQRCRPGYGYTSLPDRTINSKVPDNDGVFRYDFITGMSSLLVSFADMLNQGCLPENWEIYEQYVNHLSFNPSATKFIFLHILSTTTNRYVRLFVCDADGSNLMILNDTGKVSHYAWRNDEELLCFCKLKSLDYMSYVVYDLSKNISYELSNKLPKKDGHPTFFDNGHRLLLDTYPNVFGYQSLSVFNLQSEKFEFSKKLFRSKIFSLEWRTDLHPRLSRSEKLICVDDEFMQKKAIRIYPLYDY